MKYISLWKREYTPQYVDNYMRALGINNSLYNLKTILCYPSDHMEVNVCKEDDFERYITHVFDFFGKDLSKFKILEDNLKKNGLNI